MNYSADLLLDNVDEEGVVPERRIKDATTARALFMAMRLADRNSALMRARHQAMLDGEPPYDQGVLAARGQGARTNVNWGDAEAVMSSVMSGMIDINNSVERLIKAPLLKSAVPDDETRFNFENTLADELTRCIRGWEGYDFNYQNLAHHCFGHGVGIAYHPDSRDWRYNTSGLSDFIVPRGTKASEHKIPIAGFIESYELHEIYEKIRDEGIATDLGWNVEAVKRAMLRAHPDTRTNSYSVLNWEKLQEMMRGNDYGTMGRTEKVRIIHLWVQEFDGSVSICLISEDPLTTKGGGTRGDDWLYESRGEYQQMRRAFTAFTYGIGDHGTYHSISGILRKIFPQVQSLNRAQSSLVDAVGLGTSILLQPKTEQAYEKLNIVVAGGVSVLPSLDHFDVVERAMPNVAQGAMPVIGDLRNTITRRAGQFQGDNGFQGGGSKEKTRFEVQAELESLGKVGATQANLWYVSWTRLMRECVRRITREGYDIKEPGGEEVAEFKKRLLAAGFPLHLLKSIDIDGVVAERAVGAGSGAARTATLLQLSELAGEYDAIGKYNLTRDRTAAALGGSYDMANRYCPPRQGARPPLDQQISILENAAMEDGNDIPITVNQLHVVHLDNHLPFLQLLCQHVDEGSVPIDEKSVTAMTMLQSHSTNHLEAIQDDPVIAQRVAEYRQVLQALGEVIGNSQKHLEAEQRKAQEEQGQAGGGQNLPPEYELKLMESKIKLNAMDQQARLKQAAQDRKDQQQLIHKQRSFQMDAAHQDARTAGQLITDQKVTDAKVQSQQRITDAKVQAAKTIAENKPKPPTKPKSK